MANRQQVDALVRDVRSWNRRRIEQPDVRPDLRNADLSQANLSRAYLFRATLDGADLSGADLSGADLSGADLSGADLSLTTMLDVQLFEADLSNANISESILSGANMTRTILSGADLTGADLTGANLTGANLTDADLTGADLTGANLDRADLVRTELEDATLTSARVYGASVWDVRGTPSHQHDLVITPDGTPDVTVDNLKVAQFIYLLLSNDEIRDVIDTITSKAVLLLGRFGERKPFLDAVRADLRERHNYSPIVFDFEKPATKTVADTVRLLANLARFVIVDLTNATSANFEVGIITNLGLRRLPIAFMIQDGYEPMSMLSTDVLDYREVVNEVHRYKDLSHLSATLVDAVVVPAEELWKELNPQTSTLDR